MNADFHTMVSRASFVFNPITASGDHPRVHSSAKHSFDAVKGPDVHHRHCPIEPETQAANHWSVSLGGMGSAN